MRTRESRYGSRITRFAGILLAILLATTGCAPRITSTVDVPIGDDLTTAIVEGRVASPYGGDVPIAISKGTYTASFSATVKVMSVDDTRTIAAEITSPTTLGSQRPGHVMAYLYLCQPLSTTADKLPDGTIGYKGEGYPQVIAGKSYDVVGVLQHGWQDYPMVYVPTAADFKLNTDYNHQALLAAAWSFADQIMAAMDHQMTRQPEFTFNSSKIQPGKIEVTMEIDTEDVLNPKVIDAELVIAGELQYLQDHGAALSVAARKAVEDDIAYWRGTIEHAMNVPSETSYSIKVVGDVDVAGNIDAGSLQVYVDNGVKGSNYVPAAESLEGIRSLRVTVAQAYANAKSLASGASAKITMMERTNVTSSGDPNAPSTQYDAVPFTWDVAQNTLRSSGTTVLHVNDVDNWGRMLLWCSGSPLLAVQQWSYRERVPCVTATSKDISLLALPVGMQYAPTTQNASTMSDSMAYWYAPEEEAFVAAPSELFVSEPRKTLNGVTLTIVQHALAPGSKDQTLAVPVPSGMWKIAIVYGSGSIRDGFMLVEASKANVPINTPDALWFLRMNGGKESWIRCGDLSGFGGSLFGAIGPTFARIGSLLYFVQGHGKIACIDTTAPSPSITWPEKLNALLDDIYQKGGTDPAAPIPAEVASDNGMLIIEYPDVNWNRVYYAVDASGTVLGSLRADKTSVTSFDAKGRQGSSLPFKNASDNISLPSVDLFE